MLQKTKFAFLLALLHEDVIFKKTNHIAKLVLMHERREVVSSLLWSPQRCHSGVTTGESESVKQRGEQLDCVPVILLRVPPPTHHTRPATIAPARRREEERTERRDETGPFHWRRSVWRQSLRGEGLREVGAWPLCYPDLCPDSLSVFTLSKSICHRNCGTKREGSLPGRTHSERNEEKTATNGQEWRLCVGGGCSSSCLTSNYTATVCAMRH